MDKILSEMERQRRAESIYYTRRNNNYDYEDDKKGNNIYKRLFQFILFINLFYFPLFFVFQVLCEPFYITLPLQRRRNLLR